MFPFFRFPSIRIPINCTWWPRRPSHRNSLPRPS